MPEFKRLDRRLVHKGSITEVYVDDIAIPNGNIAHWDFIKHKGASAIVPVMPDGRILMVSQYRNALDRFTLEIPAGGRNSLDEDFLVCAKRELKEETGYTSDKFEHLLTLNTTVAFCDELIEIYVVFIEGEQGEQDLDEDEYINVQSYRLEDLCDMIYAGKMTDSKTISAIMAYKNKYVK